MRADACRVLPNAAYRKERPWLAFAGDLRRELMRPTRAFGVVCVLVVAAHFGAPVDRVVPSPVKGAYADGRAWQTKNASKLGCLTTHSLAMSSGSERRVAEAERRCSALEAQYGR